MDKKASLAKKSIIYSIGNLGTLAINFFLVPLYTFFLSKEDLGFFDLLASSLVLASPLFFGHIELAVLRWILANKDETTMKRVTSNFMAVFLIGMLVFTLIYFLIGQLIDLKHFYYVYVYLVSNFIYIVFKQVLRAMYSQWHYVSAELVYLLIILIGILFFGREYQLKAIFISYGFASSALLIYLLGLGLFNKVKTGLIDYEYCKELLNYSLPLSLNAASLWLNNQSSKYVIALYLSLSTNGIYAIAFKFAYIIQILNRIFYMSFQDKMFSIYGSKGSEEYFSDTLNKYMGILFSLLYLITGFQRWLVPLVIDKEFVEAVTYIPILALGVVFMSLASLLGIVYQCEKKNINAFKTSFVSGLFIVVFAFMLIPSLNLYGACLVFMIGNFIWLCYRFFDVQSFLKLNISIKKFFALLFLSILLWTAYNIKGFEIQVFVALCSLFFCFVVNRKVLSGYLMGRLKV